MNSVFILANVSTLENFPKTQCLKIEKKKMIKKLKEVFYVHKHEACMTRAARFFMVLGNDVQHF